MIQKLKQVQNNMINYIYLPPEQRPMVTAVSTKLHQLCGTTVERGDPKWGRKEEVKGSR
jgi:hypothetical protein